MRAFHVAIAMIAALTVLRLVVIVRRRPTDRWEELKLGAGGWLNERLDGVRVSTVVVVWVIVCVAVAAVAEWLRLR